MQPDSDSDYKRVRSAYLEPGNERNLEIFNIETIKLAETLLYLHPEYQDLLSLNVERTQILSNSGRHWSMLTTVPFCLFSPAFSDIRIWRSLITQWPSEALTNAKDSLPADIFDTQKCQVRHANQMYLHLIREVAASHVLAPALLGMSRELLNLLGNISASDEIALLYGAGALPLFKWRMNSQRFWYDYEFTKLTRAVIAHHLMHSAPPENRSSNLPRKAIWETYNFKKSTVDDYRDALITYGFRAASVTKVLRSPPDHARKRFKGIHGKASTCGNSPRALSWIIQSAHNRLHSSFFVYLYRNGNTAFLSSYLPFLAALNVYEKMFETKGMEKYLSADRAFNLLQMMATDSSLHVAACRRCGTEYLISNSPEKIELVESFECPSCSKVRGKGGKNIMYGKTA
jgi:hypothetical protein